MTPEERANDAMRSIAIYALVSEDGERPSRRDCLVAIAEAIRNAESSAFAAGFEAARQQAAEVVRGITSIFPLNVDIANKIRALPIGTPGGKT